MNPEVPVTEVPATFDHFSLERELKASPQRTFAAWSQPDQKQVWFAGPAGWTPLRREMDFRIGGTEYLKGQFPGEVTSTFDAQYLDVVPDQRVVYAYSMRLNDELISFSLTTVEFFSTEVGCRMKFSEQVTYVNGYTEPGSRERGSNMLLDRVVAHVEGTTGS